jgi:hypothetical protein
MKNVKRKRVAVNTVTVRASCSIYSTVEVPCPLCSQRVRADTTHECERDGGVSTVRNRPGFRLEKDR